MPAPATPATAGVRRGSGRLTRLTVNLTPRSVEALGRLVEGTRNSKTDCINRALQVCAYLEAATAAGGALYLGPGDRADHADLERLHFV